MELVQYLIKVLLSLALVVAVIVLALPYLMRRLTGIKSLRGDGSFEIKKIQPITRSVHIVEILVKGKTILLVVSERGADVIYREDDKAGGGGPSEHRGSGGSESGPASR